MMKKQQITRAAAYGTESHEIYKHECSFFGFIIII